MKMEISITEALCGFQKVIKTLDERQLVVCTTPGWLCTDAVVVRHFRFLQGCAAVQSILL